MTELITIMTVNIIRYYQYNCDLWTSATEKLCKIIATDIDRPVVNANVSRVFFIYKKWLQKKIIRI